MDIPCVQDCFRLQPSPDSVVSEDTQVFRSNIGPGKSAFIFLPEVIKLGYKCLVLRESMINLGEKRIINTYRLRILYRNDTLNLVLYPDGGNTRI